jgi:hypothetical protein
LVSHSEELLLNNWLHRRGHRVSGECHRAQNIKGNPITEG